MLQQHGTVLVTVLIFLILLSFLSFSGIEISIVEMKMSKNLQRRQQIFFAVDASLHEAEDRLMQNEAVTCLSHEPLFNDDVWQVSKPICSYSWQAVSINYHIEKLDEDACAQLALAKAPGIVYYRVTAWTYEKAVDDTVPALALQSTVAKQVANLNPCTSASVRFIKTPGRQSWRMLESN